MVQTGAAVGCFNVSITDENRDQFYWNTTPLFQEELVLFARADAPDREVTLDELEGRTLLYALRGYYRASPDPKLSGRFEPVRVVGLDRISGDLHRRSKLPRR